MVRSRHRIIGPDDPTICYKNDIYSLLTQVVIEYHASIEPWKKINRYIYVGNNPVNFTDPLGLEEEQQQEAGLLKDILSSVDALAKQLQGETVDGTAVSLRVSDEQIRLISEEKAREENQRAEIINKGLDALISSEASDVANLNQVLKGLNDVIAGARSRDYNKAIKGGIIVLGAIEAAKELSGSEEKPSAIGEKSEGALHGSDLRTKKKAEGYSLRDRDTGQILKYGETTQHTKRYTKKFLRKQNAEMVSEASGTKQEMHDWQNQKIIEYKKTHGGERPPLNKTDW